MNNFTILQLETNTLLLLSRKKYRRSNTATCVKVNKEANWIIDDLLNRIGNLNILHAEICVRHRGQLRYLKISVNASCTWSDVGLFNWKILSILLGTFSTLKYACNDSAQFPVAEQWSKPLLVINVWKGIVKVKFIYCIFGRSYFLLLVFCAVLFAFTCTDIEFKKVNFQDWRHLLSLFLVLPNLLVQRLKKWYSWANRCIKIIVGCNV